VGGGAAYRSKVQEKKNDIKKVRSDTQKTWGQPGQPAIVVMDNNASQVSVVRRAKRKKRDQGRKGNHRQRERNTTKPTFKRKKNSGQRWGGGKVVTRVWLVFGFDDWNQEYVTTPKKKKIGE